MNLNMWLQLKPIGQSFENGTQVQKIVFSRKKSVANHGTIYFKNMLGTWPHLD